jgi:hypothetical protein
VPGSSTARSTETVHSPLVGAALSEAVDLHVASLNPTERGAFENAQHNLTESQLSERLRGVDKEHADRSVLCKRAEDMELTFVILKRLADIVAVATSANPIAAIVLGTARVVFEAALGFLTYFGKLANMIAHFAGIVDALTKWPEQSIRSPCTTPEYECTEIFCAFYRLCMQSVSTNGEILASGPLCRSSCGLSGSPSRLSLQGI